MWFFSSIFIKKNMSEVYDNLAHEKFTIKSLLNVWQNDDVFLRTEVDENIITINYYYNEESWSWKRTYLFKKIFEGGKIW